MSVQHPDYPIETKKLAETIQFIENYIKNEELPIESQAATTWSAVAVSRIRLESLEAMKQARQEPYFGRLDIRFADTDRPEPIYVGKYEIAEENIFSWANPKVREYYYNLEANTLGKLLRKRTFEIDEDQLRRIFDEYIDPTLAKTLPPVPAEFVDQLLQQLLKQSRQGQLHDIVATIQQQQYRLIQSPLEQLLIVQGAPGSGKTQIALHRVSYLLYQHREDRRVVANRVLILGPNPIFMKYVEQVLPDLGNRRLLQRTFDDWVLERLGDKLKYDPQDKSLEDLLDESLSLAERVMHYRNAQNKGSLKMGQLLERYVEWQHDQLMEGRSDLVCQVRVAGRGREPLTIIVTVTQIRDFMNQTRQLPFNQRRDALIQQLRRHIRAEIASQLGVQTLNEQQTKDFDKAINPQLSKYFTDWEKLNASKAYRRLLRTPEILRQVGVTIFDEWDLELLAQDAPTERVPFRFSDLAALLYFKLLLDGSEQTRYDHIVVDEAQDLTPLHFKVLHQYSRNGSMTVLGDLAQSIYPHHSLDSWGQLAEIAGSELVKTEVIHQSYRSTRQIAETANRLLRRTAQDKSFEVVPFPRDGPWPQFQSFNHGADMLTTLISTVTNEQKQGRHSIALIAKTSSACTALARALSQQGFNKYELINRGNATYQGGVVIIPAHLIKGLEFDTAILTDADALTYPPDTLHARLLYVAITRAVHTLHIWWTGQLTPMLDRDRPSVSLAAFLPGVRDYHLLTIEAFAASQPDLSADWFVERLAGAGRLHLLRQGKLDETVLAILRRSFRSAASTTTETISPLAEPRRLAIHNQIVKWQQMNQPQVQEALVFSELVYGLLRHTLQQYGLLLAEGGSDFLADHMVSLATLLVACREQSINLSASRGIGRKRALEVLLRRDEAKGAQLLDLLIEYGFVVENANRSLIHVPQERMQDLLELSLGHRPADWDQDLLAQLNLLPQPLTLEVVAHLEVNHG